MGQKAIHWHVTLGECYRFSAIVVDVWSPRHSVVIFLPVEVAAQSLRVLEVLSQRVDGDVQLAVVPLKARVLGRHRRTRRHRYLHQHVTRIQVYVELGPIQVYNSVTCRPMYASNYLHVAEILLFTPSKTDKKISKQIARQLGTQYVDGIYSNSWPWNLG